MKTFKKILSVLPFIFWTIITSAQQAPLFTHYMDNTLEVNPAYAGSRDALTVMALHRSQWTGFTGAPVTQTITAHMPLENEHIGLGLALLNDKIGPSNNTSFFADFSYIIKLTEKSKLALGLSAGMNIYQASLSSLQLDIQVDPSFANNINNRITPNFGFGAYYSRERFYAGISIPALLQNSYSVVKEANGSDLVGKEQRHYFLIAGALFNITDNLDLKPTTLIKVTPNVPIQEDFTISIIVIKKILFGAMFRTGDAFGGLVGFNFTSQLYLGYSYDWSYGIQTYNQGSHELVLRYDFLFYAKQQIHSPRNF
jgi:type IX secretion system PorP/SprF family membrane protein